MFLFKDAMPVSFDRKCLHLIFNQLKTPVTPEWRPYSVPTALKNAERRGARCANASNAVQTLWERCAIA